MSRFFVWLFQMVFPSDSKKKVQILKTLKYKESQDPYLGHVFRIMGISTLILFIIVCDYFLWWFQVENGRAFYIFFMVIASLILNYVLWWKDKKYRKYFYQFKMKGYKKSDYVVALLFHLGILSLFVFKVLSV